MTADDAGHVLNVVYGGPIDPTNAVPVRYQLPDGDGLLLAAYGSRISMPTETGMDILVVPSDTTQVTVTSSSGHSHTVELGK